MQPDVLVDFTSAPYAVAAAKVAIAHGVRPVIGTSGLSAPDVAELVSLCQDAQLGGVVAPNFALGAVVLMRLAAIAGRYFDYAEIIEQHHEAKADARLRHRHCDRADDGPRAGQGLHHRSDNKGDAAPTPAGAR